MIYIAVFFGLLIIFVCVRLLFTGRVHASAWWGNTHTGLVEEAVSRLAGCGEKEAASFFAFHMTLLKQGATAPDRAGDIDSAFSGGAHYGIVKKKQALPAADRSFAACLLSEREASYLKRAGMLLDFTGVLRERSPYLKTACTIAEENYTTALFYAVRFRNSGEVRDIAFAAECLGRALHGIADSAAIPHCIGKRYFGKRSYHYRFESLASSVSFSDRDPKRFSGTGEILSKLRTKVQNASFRGDFVRRTSETLALRSAALYYSGKETTEKSVIEGILSDTADACAAILFLFYSEMKRCRRIADVLLEEEPGEHAGGASSGQEENLFLIGAYGSEKKETFPVKLSFCDAFPAFLILPQEAERKRNRVFFNRFRVVRSGRGKFYITVSGRKFRKILRIGKRAPYAAAFRPDENRSFVTFYAKYFCE